MAAPNLLLWEMPNGALYRRGRGLPVVRHRRLPALAGPRAGRGDAARSPARRCRTAVDGRRRQRAASARGDSAEPRGEALFANDKDKDGKIAREELLAPRRKAYAKLDANGNGELSFDEWAVKTLTKFGGADKDRTGWLTAAEYASTAPPPPKKKRCAC